MLEAKEPFRLFKVIGADGKPRYFKHKQMAKGYRDEVGGVVMRGPDHRRGESFNVSQQTPSSKRAAW